ncbi:hypothetical protein GCK72_018935 [Caenorhabditis remanei]|uniref:T20D4.11-like domain-containing protein n=1 Tax=Caenorhabditis remanei TaxID=31234 RepID=A0A6A5GBD0_CAERE|nr:hypothetical protein GCK72_018935 [Caenorhabditis remanei]KAF1752380.1 hypothetical protein GCK72_018935 [Caenorhabditis remanei]
MTVAFLLYILTIFFVSRIFGSDDVVCVPAEGGNEQCIESFNGVRENILLLNQTIKENIDKLNKHCQEFEKCSETLKCGAEKELIDLVDDVNAFCEASIFRHTPLF